jgi:hypothetical protein
MLPVAQPLQCHHRPIEESHVLPILRRQLPESAELHSGKERAPLIVGQDASALLIALLPVRLANDDYRTIWGSDDPGDSPRPTRGLVHDPIGFELLVLRGSEGRFPHRSENEHEGLRVEDERSGPGPDEFLWIIEIECRRDIRLMRWRPHRVPGVGALRRDDSPIQGQAVSSRATDSGRRSSAPSAARGRRRKPTCRRYAPSGTESRRRARPNRRHAKALCRRRPTTATRVRAAVGLRAGRVVRACRQRSTATNRRRIMVRGGFADGTRDAGSAGGHVHGCLR